MPNLTSEYNMRRYVTTVKPIATKKKAKSTKAKRVQPVMTEADIASLPQSVRDSIVIPPPKIIKPKAAKPVKDEVESVFVNARCPGSKVLNYRRSNKQPLRTFDDRLAQSNVISRDDDSFSFRDNDYKVIIWTVSSEPALFHDPNLRLIDIEAEPEPPKLSYIVSITLENSVEPCGASSARAELLDTPAGLVCPNCKTNEYVKSDLKNMPVTFQQNNWRHKDNFGSHCELCRCPSPLRV